MTLTCIKIFPLTTQKNPAKLYSASAQCGCSSMVERQLPKLHTRVRFPSPAPYMQEVSNIKTNTLAFSKKLAIVFCCLMASACSSYDDTHDHPQLKSGQALYNHHCALCHGEDGTGKLADQTPASILTKRNRNGIADYIRKDIGSDRDMPVFKNMPTQEALSIAGHIQLLRARYDAMPSEQKKSIGLLIEP